MSEENNDLTLGKFLQKILEEKNISLEQLHENTKVSKKYLNIILNDDYENYPPEVYLKGYLKKIANFLDIDYSNLEERFIKNIASKKEAELKPKYDPILLVDEKSNEIKFLLLGILIIVIFVLVFFHFKKKEPSSNLQSKPKKIVKKHLSQKKKKLDNKTKISFVKTKPLTIPAQKTQKNSINDNATKILKIFAEELTWVRITIDNKTVKKLFLNKGDNVTFEGKKYFKLDIGNAGGIKIKFNNKELGYPGKRGEVKHLILK